MVEVVCGEEAAGFRAVARHMDRRRGRAATAAELSWLRRGPVQLGQRQVRRRQHVLDMAFRAGW